MTEKRTIHQSLVELANLWPMINNDLPPAQVAAVGESARNLADTIDGVVTADFVVGLSTGVVALHTVTTQTQPPIATMMSSFTGSNTADASYVATMAVAAKLATMLLDGEL